VRLVGRRVDAKMIAERSGRDWTMAMKRFAAIRTNELAELRLSGYVFKKTSPSCGVERVRVYDAKSMPARRGRASLPQP
ncbi:MAG: 2-thiouracil desulfurase family protein, partial [Candidatus Binatia bacterium]